MKLVLTFLFFAVASIAQDFDRLTIRPRFSFSENTFKSGIVEWCQSGDWPIIEPECIGLRSP